MSILITEDVVPYVRIVATADQSLFSFNWTIFEDSDLVVLVNGDSALLADTPANSSQYSVTGAGGTAGSVTFGGSGLNEGDVVELYRVTPRKHLTDLPSSGPYSTDDIDLEFDRVYAMLQEQGRDNSNAIRVPIGEIPAVLPVAADRIGMFLAFDAAGQPSLSHGTGADAGLREDLAEPTGAALMGYLSSTAAAKFAEHTTPDDYGAIGDNIAYDNQAFDDALENSDILFLNNTTYRLNPGVLMPYIFRNQSKPDKSAGYPVYGAVVLDRSELTFSGPGSVRIAMREGVATSNEIEFGFVTAQNVERGTLTDIVFRNINFDVNNDDVGTANTNQRAMHLIGVSRLSLNFTNTISTGERRGGGFYIDNCENVLALGYRATKNSSGFNVKMTDDIVVSGIIIDDVNEAFDFDGTSRGVVFGFACFKGCQDPTNTNYLKQQPIDINGTRAAVFMGMSLYMYGGITISYKNTTAPDYETFLDWPEMLRDHHYNAGDTCIHPFYNGGDPTKPVGYNFYICTVAGTTSPVGLGPQTKTAGIVDGTATWDYVDNPFQLTPAQLLALIGISGINCGAAGSNCLVIGNEWSVSNNLHHKWGDPVHDIVVMALQYDLSTPIAVLEGRRIKLIGNSQINVRVAAGTGPYALQCTSSVAMDDAYEYSDLTIAVVNHSIDGAEQGGISFGRARRVQMSGCTVSNINTTATAGMYAVSFTNLETRAATVFFSDNNVDGDIFISGSTAAVTAWATGQAIRKNMIRKANGQHYEAKNNGTTAAVGTGPSGFGSNIADGTVNWRWVPPFKFLWDATNNCTGVVSFSGDAQQFIHGTRYPQIVGNVGAAALTDRTFFIAERRAFVPRCCLVVNTAVVADAVNYRTIQIRRWRDGVATIIGQVTSAAGWAAHTKISIPIAVNEPNAYLLPGDSVDWFFTTPGAGTGGAGVALNGLTIQPEVIEY